MVEQVIANKLTIPDVMLGLHRVNLVEMRRFDELDPREPNEELVEDLVKIPLFEKELSKTCKISLTLTGWLREDLI